MSSPSRTPAQQLATAITERLAAGVDAKVELTDEQVERAALLLRPTVSLIPSQRTASRTTSRPYSAA